MNIPTKVVQTNPISSKQLSNLLMHTPKRVGDRGQDCLNSILQLISFDQPLVFKIDKNVLIKSYHHNSQLKRSFELLQIFQSLVLGTMSNIFLKSTNIRYHFYYYDTPPQETPTRQNFNSKKKNVLYL